LEIRLKVEVPGWKSNKKSQVKRKKKKGKSGRGSRVSEFKSSTFHVQSSTFSFKDSRVLGLEAKGA
jgi:hypothetical protein